MSEGPILDPLAPGAGVGAALADRLGALESRIQAVPPVPFPMSPYLPGSTNTSWQQTITGGTFYVGNTVPWVAVVPRIARTGALCMVPWVTDGATVGGLELSHTGATVVTSEIVLPAGSSGTATFRWLHNLDPQSGQKNFDLLARRASGAGNVYIGYPLFFLVDPAGCSIAGV